MSSTQTNRGDRPADLARILLARGFEPPRQRARDQQADRAGAALKVKVLEKLLARNPDALDFEAALCAIVEELGEPWGPTRGVCSSILDDWQAWRASREFRDWLSGQATADDKPE